MSDNLPHKDLLAIRREKVAALRARGKTQRQIRDELAKMNPPIKVGLGTVNRDLQFIRDKWKNAAAESIEEWVARELADLDELEKQAWAEKRYDLVLKIKDRRAKLLGLDKPMRTELAGADGKAIEVSIAREAIQRKLARIAGELEEG